MISFAGSKEAARFSGRWCLAWLLVAVGTSVESSRANSPPSSPVAGIFLGEWRGTDTALARQMRADVGASGYQTRFIGPDALTNFATLRSLNLDLLVLPQAQSLPVDSMKPVEEYLHGGGRLMAMGLPAWDSATFKFNGQWLSREDYQRRIDSQAADHVLADFAHGNLSRWKSSGDGSHSKTETELVTDEGQPAVHVTIEDLTSWNVLLSPTLTEPFAGGRSLTCFRARGSRDTRQMSIEWREQDGSRWIAVIDLATNWKSYCLTPDAFKFWESVRGRGGPGDHLNVQKAIQLSVGLARSHSGLPGPHHDYWIGTIGSARSPFGDLPMPNPDDAPRLDTLSPNWKFYPMHGPLKVATPPGLNLAPPAKLRLSAKDHDLPQAIQPRPRGIGFNQERPWRWQPLLEARSPNGDYRGAMATLLIHLQDEFRHGIWACFTPGDGKVYRQGSMRRLIRETARALRRGLFLEEGGAEYFTAFEGQPFALGARAVNLGPEDEGDLGLRITVKSKAGGNRVYAREWPLALAAGATVAKEEQWQPAAWPEGGLVVTAELLQGGIVIDHLEHELNVWRPKKNPSFIEARDGGFWLAGRPWKVNGVNYMPATGIGISSGDYFEHWLGKGAYDPGAIERDLDRIRGMGLNAVSIFVEHSSMRARHLPDFLRRCDALGLHVNQSLRPGTPLDFEWDKMKDLIEYFHLAENDTIFAYDLAWEAEHVNQQHYYGRDWTAWVNKHYGGIAPAETAWGVPAPALQDDGTLSVPPMRDLAQDGPWRALATDYRAFLDEELAKYYGEARRLIRSIDPHHAVSFRMNEAGDPTFISEQRLPFDFYGLARAVDLWAPEGYGRIGDWEHVREGRFDQDYARLCDPTKPFIWAEMGYTVWDETEGEPSGEKMDFAAAFFRDFYRMMTAAGCDGYFSWWYPGGFRVNEHSDYGIINPDGTDRPVTKVIRQQGPVFLQAAKPPAPNYFITVNRDRDARGLFGIYQAVKKDYWRALAEGKIPGLKWETEPGKK